MPGWSKLAAASASRRKRLRCAFVAHSPSPMTFNATVRLRVFWRARNTTPWPPRPISSSSSYSPKSFDIRAIVGSNASLLSSKARPVRNRQTLQTPCGASANTVAPHSAQTLLAFVILFSGRFTVSTCTAGNSFTGYVCNTAMKCRSSSSTSSCTATVWAISSSNNCR